MSNLLYGGISYPNTPFVFDKIYKNYADAKEGAARDNVLIGRYILVAYTDKALTESDRLAIEADVAIHGGPRPPAGYEENTDKYKYYMNFLKDNQESWDRHAMRKIYVSETKTYTYQDIASLNANLSLNIDVNMDDAFVIDCGGAPISEE